MTLGLWSRTFVALVAAVAFAYGCDPVHSNEVSALGGETPGVRTGPQHRPGQPCLLCHDGKLGSPREFSVAGTVFQTQDARIGASGADVKLIDSNDDTYTAQTNAAGNFYVTPQQWTPAYPVSVTVTYGGATATMHTRIGRDGACGGCHVDPAGPSSPGHIYAQGAPE